MIFLRIIAEGQTEQAFVRDLLAPRLTEVGVTASCSCVHNSNERSHQKRGGGRDWAHWRRDIVNTLTEHLHDPSWFTSMMLDLYGMSPFDERVPGWEETKGVTDPIARAKRIESHIFKDICQSVGGELGENRFIPYVQVHEFEALLLCDLRWLRQIQDGPSAEQIEGLQKSVAAYSSPEHVNDGPTTAPSKRIAAVWHAYSERRGKRVFGPIAAGEIGLEAMRERCAHFNEWLARIEGLGQPQP